MNRQQYLLSCVSEECHEVGQRAIKQARFGDTQRQNHSYPTNHDRTWNEFLELMAVMEMAGFTPRLLSAADLTYMAAKKLRVEETLQESAGYGLVQL